MKKRFYVLFLLLSSVFAYGQEEIDLPEEAREKIEAARVAFITKELDLSTEEAQEFWPIFNEYDEGQRKIRKEIRRLRRRADVQSDAELESDFETLFRLRRQEVDLEEACFKKLKTVISIRKVSKLHEAEHKFKKLMLESLRDRRRERRGG